MEGQAPARPTSKASERRLLWTAAAHTPTSHHPSLKYGARRSSILQIGDCDSTKIDQATEVQLRCCLYPESFANIHLFDRLTLSLAGRLRRDIDGSEEGGNPNVCVFLERWFVTEARPPEQTV